jgi:hypothetical protein
MRYALIGVLLLVGCGDDDSRLPPIEGTAWVSSTSEHCSVAVIFENADAYRWLYTCSVADGKPTTYVEDGTFVVRDSRITLVPHSASCPSAAPRTDRLSVEIQPGSGSLTFGDRSFVKIAPGAGDASGWNTGCFDASGAFTPAPLASLP